MLLASAWFLLHSQWWPGVLSLKDLAADLVGTCFALGTLVTIEATWGRPFTHKLGSAISV